MPIVQAAFLVGDMSARAIQQGAQPLRTPKR
jgi:hypothetical protein